jgi:hypothetical protein
VNLHLCRSPLLRSGQSSIPTSSPPKGSTSSHHHSISELQCEF